MTHKRLLRAPQLLHPTLAYDGATLVVVIPGLKLVSEANKADHEHWRVRAKRAKDQRTMVAMVLRSLVGGPLPLPLDVEMIRTGPGHLDEPGNLWGSVKHVQDGVADWMGVDDRDKRYTWRVAQTFGGKGVYAVTIRITPRTSTEEQLCVEWKGVLG